MQVTLRVTEQLDTSWQGWFEGLEITYEPGKGGLLKGELPDLAALYGLLSKIISLGLTLTSFESESSATRTETFEKKDEKLCKHKML